MKHWPRRFSHGLALFAGAAIAVELAFLEVQRRKAFRLTVQWRQQLRQSAELEKASPACTPENEQAMTAELLQWRREVEALRGELFPKSGRPAGEASSDERVDVYFDVAALIARLRAAAAAANVMVKPDEHFGFGAYANEAPPATELARLRYQCLIVETLLGSLFSGRPRELLAMRPELDDRSQKAAGRRQRNSVGLETGSSPQGGNDVEALSFRVEFSGETGVLRTFLNALARTEEFLVVRSVEVAPAAAAKTESAAGTESTREAIARPAVLRFSVTVEAIRPTQNFAARTP